MTAQQKPVSGKTVPYAVLGHPIGHTLSPIMHQAALDRLGMDARYLAFDVAPDRLPPVLDSMYAMGFNGVNLTVPLKEVAFRALPDKDESAARLGAVNTLARTDDGWRGYNTDGEGFLVALREAFAMQPAGRSVFVVGAGGAGRAVALTCAFYGAHRISITDLDATRIRAVAAEIRRSAPGVTVEGLPAGDPALPGTAGAAELIVQASPLGMKPDDPPALPSELFHAGQSVYDLVYMFPETVTMRAAARRGARTANGLGMLLHQGALALRLWTGAEVPVEDMRRALETAVYGG